MSVFHGFFCSFYYYHVGVGAGWGPWKGFGGRCPGHYNDGELSESESYLDLPQQPRVHKPPWTSPNIESQARNGLPSAACNPAAAQDGFSGNDPLQASQLRQAVNTAREATSENQ